VRVAAAPERGKANDAVLELLAETLASRARASRSFRAGLAEQDRRADRRRAGEIERRLATAGGQETQTG
jgi:uncharacterized protein YggU (UPF0235/DUF167 family)